MPNNVKNRIEILGTREQVKEVVERFLTYHEKSIMTASDVSMIICNDKENNFAGWYSEREDEFEYASKRGEKIKGLPDGFSYQYNDAFIQMPDFNKVFKCPDELNIESGSNGDIGYSIITGESENQFMSMGEIFKRFYERDNESKVAILEMGLKYFKNVEAYGCKTWYDWCVENWGTKWNSYSCEKLDDNVFTFETAWSGVPKIIEAMSKGFPSVEFKYAFADEDTGNNVGLMIFKDGLINENIPEGGSKEAYDMAFELHPDSKEYYELIDGEYQYIEEE